MQSEGMTVHGKDSFLMDMRQTHELRNRLLFTALVVAAYMLCRSILLYGVAADEMVGGSGAQYFLSTLVSGDRYRMTVMALGIAPYLNASLLVQIIFAFRNSTSRAKISKIQSDRWMRWVSVVFSVVMAVVQSYGLSYRPDAGPLWLVRSIVILEMFGGAMLTSLMCLENERHGVGASMPIILLNIVLSLAQNMSANHFFEFPAIALLCLVAIAATAYMENSMIKVPLQRVSIHNVHADQNYLAYKRAPMGIMPVMFASSAFLLPYYLVHMLAGLYPENAMLVSISDNMVLTRPLGVAVYLVLIVALAVLFSFLMLNPRETAHQMQRNGDSIVGMYAGEQTKRFLTSTVLRWSLISGVLQASCMAASLVLSMQEMIPAALAMDPTSMMIVTSIVCSLGQEIASYYRYDAYRFFM